MGPWVNEINRLLTIVLGNQDSALEYVIVRGGALLAMFLVYWMIIYGAGNCQASATRVFMALVAGVLVMGGSASALSSFVMPKLPDTNLAHGLLFVVPIILVIVVALPVQRVLLKSNYVGSLMAFGAAMAVMVFAGIGAQGLFNALAQGGDTSAKIRRQSASYVDVIDR